MKIKILLFVAVIGFAITSCDSFKDLTAVSVDTDLKVDVPLEDSSVGLKSASLALNEIKGNGKINLAENTDTKDYVDGIRSLKTLNPLASITGVEATDEITNLVVKATVEGTVFTIFNSGSTTLTAANVTDMVVDGTEIENMVTKLGEVGYDKDVVFNVTGSSKELVGKRLKLKIKIPTTVKYTPL